MTWNWFQSWVGAAPLNVKVGKSAPKRRLKDVCGSRVEFLEQRLVLTPTSDEQLFVYLLNQARHDPQAYDDEAGLGGILDGVEARQPLAVDDDLFDSARFHADEMAEFNYFAHQSPVTADWPNQMAVDQGYVLPNFFPLNTNNIESLAAGNLYGNPADVIELLIVDEGVPSLGHRNHLLGIDEFNAQAREIGVGHGFDISSIYDHYWAAHITFSDANDTFLTGVVYQDTNANQVFSLNEGLPGVTVTIAGIGLQTVTNSAGGWSIKVPGSGSFTVTASGGTFVGTTTTTVDVDDLNREVDFISGNPVAIVDFDFSVTTPNDPPVNTVPVGPLNIQEDVAFSITGVSISDPDSANTSVSVTLSVSHGTLHVPVNVPSGLAASSIVGNDSGNVVLTGSVAQINTALAHGQGLVYEGTTNFSGADTLSVVTNDLGHTGTGGPQSDSDTVDLTIAAVNDAPRNTIPGATQSVVTGVTLNVTELSLSDVDLGSQPAIVTLSVLHGTITVRTDVASGLTLADVAGNGTNQVTITAPLASLLPTLQATAGVTYVSDNAYIGPDTLTMNSSDQGQTGTGGTLTDQDTVSIQVQPVPIPPTLTVPAGSVASSGGLPVIVGTGVTLVDPDSPNFSGGKLTIQITAGAQATDQLTLHKVGKKTGQLNLRKTDVRLGKTVIGHISGGTGGAPLVIQFSTNVSPSTVQGVLQNVQLQASRKRLLAGTRTIQFVATDPTHAASPPQTRDAVVTV